MATVQVKSPLQLRYSFDYVGFVYIECMRRQSTYLHTHHMNEMGCFCICALTLPVAQYQSSQHTLHDGNRVSVVSQEPGNAVR